MQHDMWKHWNTLLVKLQRTINLTFAYIVVENDFLLCKDTNTIFRKAFWQLRFFWAIKDINFMLWSCVYGILKKRYKMVVIRGWLRARQFIRPPIKTLCRAEKNVSHATFHGVLTLITFSTMRCTIILYNHRHAERSKSINHLIVLYLWNDR